MIVPHEDRVTPWRAFDGFGGVVAVRIWNRLTPFGMFQRHEWRCQDDRTRLDTWIPAAGRSWAKAAAPVGAPVDPAELLAEALNQIADGHNDPRTLAREVLNKLFFT